MSGLSPFRRKSVIRFLVVALAVSAVLFATGIGYAYLLKHRAADLVRRVAGLNLGISTFADVQRIADSYGRYRMSQEEAVLPMTTDPTGADFHAVDPCTPDKCLFSFKIDNRQLAMFRLARPAMLTVAVAVRMNVVRYVEVSLRGGRDGVHAGLVEEREQSRYGPYGFPTPVGKPYLFVRLSPEATPTQRSHAFTMKMDCLASWRACDVGCDYLPLAWQDWKHELSANGIDEHTFLYSYPHSIRCN